MTRNEATSVFVYIGALLLSTTATLGSEGSMPAQESNQNAAEDVVFGFESDMMCGPNCLWQITYAYGKDYSLRELKDMSSTDMIKGTTIEGMCEAVRQMGLQVQAVQGDVEALRRDSRTAVLLVNLGTYNHYLILDRIDKNMVRLLDGGRFVDMTVKELRSIWKGYMIFVGNGGGYVQSTRLFRYTGLTLQISSVLVLLVAVVVYSRRHIFIRKRPGEIVKSAS